LHLRHTRLVDRGCGHFRYRSLKERWYESMTGVSLQAASTRFEYRDCRNVRTITRIAVLA
jgi:hypothetical protein